MGEFSHAPSTASGPPPSRREALRIRNLTDKSEFELKLQSHMRWSSFDHRSHHKRVQALACRVLPAHYWVRRLCAPPQLYHFF